MDTMSAAQHFARPVPCLVGCSDGSSDGPNGTVRARPLRSTPLYHVIAPCAAAHGLRAMVVTAETRTGSWGIVPGQARNDPGQHQLSTATVHEQSNREASGEKGTVEIPTHLPIGAVYDCLAWEARVSTIVHDRPSDAAGPDARLRQHAAAAMAGLRHASAWTNQGAVIPGLNDQSVIDLVQQLSGPHWDCRKVVLASPLAALSTWATILVSNPPGKVMDRLYGRQGDHPGDVSACDVFGMTLLHWAALFPDQLASRVGTAAWHIPAGCGKPCAQVLLVSEGIQDLLEELSLTRDDMVKLLARAVGVAVHDMVARAAVRAKPGSRPGPPSDLGNKLVAAALIAGQGHHLLALPWIIERHAPQLLHDPHDKQRVEMLKRLPALLLPVPRPVVRSDGTAPLAWTPLLPKILAFAAPQLQLMIHGPGSTGIPPCFIPFDEDGLRRTFMQAGPQRAAYVRGGEASRHFDAVNTKQAREDLWALVVTGPSDPRPLHSTGASPVAVSIPRGGLATPGGRVAIRILYVAPRYDDSVQAPGSGLQLVSGPGPEPSSSPSLGQAPVTHTIRIIERSIPLVWRDSHNFGIVRPLTLLEAVQLALACCPCQAQPWSRDLACAGRGQPVDLPLDALSIIYQAQPQAAGSTVLLSRRLEATAGTDDNAGARMASGIGNRACRDPCHAEARSLLAALSRGVDYPCTNPTVGRSSTNAGTTSNAEDTGAPAVVHGLCSEAVRQEEARIAVLEARRSLVQPRANGGPPGEPLLPGGLLPARAAAYPQPVAAQELQANPSTPPYILDMVVAGAVPASTQALRPTAEQHGRAGRQHEAPEHRGRAVVAAPPPQDAHRYLSLTPEVVQALTWPDGWLYVCLRERL